MMAGHLESRGEPRLQRPSGAYLKTYVEHDVWVLNGTERPPFTSFKAVFSKPSK